MDNLTKMLYTKYDPSKLQEPLQTTAAVAKSEALPVHRLTSKGASGATTGMLVVMDSRKYSEDTILKAVVEFNKEYPEYMSHSFTLPTATNGISAGSWVITDIEDI